MGSSNKKKKEKKKDFNVCSFSSIAKIGVLLLRPPGFIIWAPLIGHSY